MLSPCSRGPAVSVLVQRFNAVLLHDSVAEQHWNAVPAPKLADTIIIIIIIIIIITPAKDIVSIGVS